GWFASRWEVMVAEMRARPCREKSPPSCAATVRYTLRVSPLHTQVALAFATSPDAITMSTKSRNEIARPNVLTVVGALRRAFEEVSASAPPSVGPGLITLFTPTGRSRRFVSAPARSRPAKPDPWRYRATTLSTPDGGRAPVLPSPNWTLVVASSLRRVTYTDSFLSRP